MAARKRLYHPDEVRQKIQASQLLNVLKKHAMGDEVIDRSRVEAINILLKKVMPDLSAVEMTQHEQIPAEGTIFQRLASLLSNQPDLKLHFWEYLTADLRKEMPAGESEKRQQALLSAHPDFKRRLAKALNDDLAGSAPVKAA